MIRITIRPGLARKVRDSNSRPGFKTGKIKLKKINFTKNIFDLKNRQNIFGNIFTKLVTLKNQGIWPELEEIKLTANSMVAGWYMDDEFHKDFYL